MISCWRQWELICSSNALQMGASTLSDGISISIRRLYLSILLWRMPRLLSAIFSLNSWVPSCEISVSPSLITFDKTKDTRRKGTVPEEIWWEDGSDFHQTMK